MSKEITKGKLWASRIMKGIVILFMLFDSIFKFIQPEEVVKGTLALGYSQHHIFIIGLLGFISIVIYAIPKTSFIGAILLTGYFGGAIATNFRLDNPLFSHILSPLYLAILAWGGIYLINEKLQKLIMDN